MTWLTNKVPEGGFIRLELMVPVYAGTLQYAVPDAVSGRFLLGYTRYTGQCETPWSMPS
jgi:hypothetical protein